MALSKFGSAFAEARKAGEKEFTFNGKKYTTEMAKPKAALTSAKSELGPEMGETMSATEAKDVASRFGSPKGSSRLNSEENKDTSDMSYKKGGSVSKRADGIAQRGKTRGKMC
jgi:hypothetical protein